MKVKDITNLLVTNYIEVSNQNNEYQLSYLKKSDLDNSILESEVVSIEPVAALRKQLFDDSAVEGDYVAAIKLLYKESDSEALGQEQEAETIEAEVIQDEEKEEKENPYQNPFNGTPFTSFNADFINSLITPDLINKLLSDETLKDMFSPDKIRDIINSDDFKNMINNPEFQEFSRKMSPFGSSPFSSQPTQTYEEDDDDDEYEEI